MRSISQICEETRLDKIVYEIRKAYSDYKLSDDKVFTKTYEDILYSKDFEKFYLEFLDEGGEPTHFVSVMKCYNLCYPSAPITPVVKTTLTLKEEIGPSFEWFDPTEMLRSGREEDKFKKMRENVVLEYPVNFSLPQEYIDSKRNDIHSDCVDRFGTNFPTKLNVNILVVMFNFYNKYFFNNSINDVKIEVSDRMTKTVGKFCPSDMKIVFSEAQAMNTFNKGQKEHESGGIKVYDRVKFLQLTMEHEMVHAAVWKSQSRKNTNLHESILKSHGTFFRDLIKALFGHTEIRCKLHDTVF